MSYDPYAPDIVRKYGKPGQTDNEGKFIFSKAFLPSHERIDLTLHVI